MVFFRKKKVDTSKIDEQSALDPKIQAEACRLESQITQSSQELEGITQKIVTVKAEYDETVGNLMTVKKELNQKKMELDIAQRELRETQTKSKSENIKDSEFAQKIKVVQDLYAKAKENLEESTKKHDILKEEMTEEQTALHNIKRQQIEVQKELDEASSRLYNAKDKLDKRDDFEDTSILTPSEKEFIGADSQNQKSAEGIIEAASAVVGSLKAKLNATQNELDTIQALLVKERAEHEGTKKELEELKTTKSFDEPTKS